jgi:hypothetical protein
MVVENGTSDFIRIAIIDIHPAGFCTHPNIAVAILENGPNVQATAAVWLAWLIPVYRNAIAVIFVETVGGAEPHEAAAILNDARYGIVGQAICNCKILKSQLGRFGIHRRAEQQRNDGAKKYA